MGLAPAIAIDDPSGENVIPYRYVYGIGAEFSVTPVVKFHNSMLEIDSKSSRGFLSVAAIFDPSGENAKLVMAALDPVIAFTCRPDVTSQK
jgi:hypothetical protein